MKKTVSQTLNRQGIVFTRPRDTISFFIGLFLTVLGLIPLLLQLKVLSWKLPAFMQTLPFNIAVWVIAVAGLYVVIDGFIEPPAHNLHWFLIVAGIVLFVVGLLPLLHKFGVIGFGIPFIDNMIVYNAIITVEGLLLVVGGLTEH
jgi:hypothetical protein